MFSPRAIAASICSPANVMTATLRAWGPSLGTAARWDCAKKTSPIRFQGAYHRVHEKHSPRAIAASTCSPANVMVATFAGLGRSLGTAIRWDCAKLPQAGSRGPQSETRMK